MKKEVCILIMKVKNLIFIVYFLLMTNAHAYLDPGTGSFILQLIIGGVATFFATVGIFFTRIKIFIKNFFKSKKDNVENTDK